MRQPSQHVSEFQCVGNSSQNTNRIFGEVICLEKGSRDPVLECACVKEVEGVFGVLPTDTPCAMSPWQGGLQSACWLLPHRIMDLVLMTHPPLGALGHPAAPLCPSCWRAVCWHLSTRFCTHGWCIPSARERGCAPAQSAGCM